MMKRNQLRIWWPVLLLPVLFAAAVPSVAGDATVAPGPGTRLASLTAPAPATDPPVVLVVIDALNASHTGAWGYQRDTTPALDGLARRGARFTSWISSSSWTRPAFTTILTGLPKKAHGLEMGEKPLQPRITTMAERFAKAGYRTAAFIGNPLISRKWNHHQGFEVFADESTHGPFPPADVLVDAAIRWIDGVKDRPFFLCVFLSDPHAPYEAPAAARRFSLHVTPPTTSPPREVMSPWTAAEQEAIIAAYDDEVAFADAGLGRLLDHLDAMGLGERAVVAVTADHGEMMGEHNAWQHAWHMWEPVVRVPMVLAAPGRIPAGVVVTGTAGHEDLMPTLLSLAGIPSGGPSIFTPGNRRPFTAYDAAGVRRSALREGRWKLVRYEKVSAATFGKQNDETRYPSLTQPAPRYELFDLEADPGELDNRIDRPGDPVLLESLKAELRRRCPWKQAPARIPRLDPETLDALRAAGYLE